MAVKDFDISENKDSENKPEKEIVREQPTSVSQQIKNAHATGDGSFGRNDESLPDEEELGRKSGSETNY